MESTEIVDKLDNYLRDKIGLPIDKAYIVARELIYTYETEMFYQEPEQDDTEDDDEIDLPEQDDTEDDDDSDELEEPAKETDHKTALKRLIKKPKLKVKEK